MAKLDPLGISCVNFDASPVTLGFHQVGEKRLCGVVSVQSNPDHAVFNFAFIFPLTSVLFHLFPLILSDCFGFYYFAFFRVSHFLSLLLLLFLNLNCYRYVGITLPSWTPWELCMPISICASPWILSRLLINSVRLRYRGGCDEIAVDVARCHPVPKACTFMHARDC